MGCDERSTDSPYVLGMRCQICSGYDHLCYLATRGARGVSLGILGNCYSRLHCGESMTEQQVFVTMAPIILNYAFFNAIMKPFPAFLAFGISLVIMAYMKGYGVFT